MSDWNFPDSKNKIPEEAFVLPATCAAHKGLHTEGASDTICSQGYCILPLSQTNADSRLSFYSYGALTLKPVF